MRPLFFEFPDDENAYYNVENTYMIGNAIKFTPVLKADGDRTISYFPNIKWAELEKFSIIMNYTDRAVNGQNITLKTSASDPLALHLRSGCILPMNSNKGPT